MVWVKSYDAPPVDRREILRYAGATAGDALAVELMDSCVEELSAGLCYKVCYTELPLELSRGTVKMGNISVRSERLLKNLEGCDRVIIFAATVGFFADRLIRRYSAVSPSRALMLSAIGTERVESLCDLFFEDMRAERWGQTLRPRFSPGYGDLPLELQGDIFSLLCCEKNIGLTLNGSFLMSPTKSVTAMIGIPASINNDTSTYGGKNEYT